MVNAVGGGYVVVLSNNVAFLSVLIAVGGYKYVVGGAFPYVVVVEGRVFLRVCRGLRNRVGGCGDVGSIEGFIRDCREYPLIIVAGDEKGNLTVVPYCVGGDDLLSICMECMHGSE